EGMIADHDAGRQTAGGHAGDRHILANGQVLAQVDIADAGQRIEARGPAMEAAAAQIAAVISLGAPELAVAVHGQGAAGPSRSRRDLAVFAVVVDVEERPRQQRKLGRAGKKVEAALGQEEAAELDSLLLAGIAPVAEREPSAGEGAEVLVVAAEQHSRPRLAENALRAGRPGSGQYRQMLAVDPP